MNKYANARELTWIAMDGRKLGISKKFQNPTKCGRRWRADAEYIQRQGRKLTLSLFDLIISPDSAFDRFCVSALGTSVIALVSPRLCVNHRQGRSFPPSLFDLIFPPDFGFW